MLPTMNAIAVSSTRRKLTRGMGRRPDRATPSAYQIGADAMSTAAHESHRAVTIVRTTNATMGTPTAMSAARTAPTDRRAVIATGSTRALPSASATIAATTDGLMPAVFAAIVRNPWKRCARRTG